MRILNLTQHVATPEQVLAGVVEPKNKEAVQALLTFERLPTLPEVQERAAKLAAIAASYDCAGVMIGGAPYLMAPLELALHDVGCGGKVLYSFSERVSVEQSQPDGSVRKVQTFRHAGWVEA